MLSLIIVANIALIGQHQPANHPEIAALLDAVYAPLRDVSYEYEGTFVIADPPDHLGTESPLAKPYDAFSGSLSYRSDGAMKQETIHCQYPPSARPGEPVILKTRVATLKDVTTRYGEQAGLGAAERKKPTWHDYFTVASSGRLFLVHYLRGRSRAPDTLAVHEGTQSVEGQPCEVFSFVYGPDYLKGSSDRNMTERFYLDFERGGHAIKVEFHRGSKLEWRIKDVRLESFVAADGKKVWLPVYGRFEGLLSLADRKAGTPMVYVDYPTNQETISIMKGSVKINSDLSDEHFRLRLKDGTLIKDGVTGKVIRSGKDVDAPPENLAHAQERLQNQIRDAEAQGKEVTASSLARGGGWSSLTWVPWTVALVMTVGFCIMLVRQRMRV